MHTKPNFNIHKSSGADVLPGSEQSSWSIKIPSGTEGNYRLAQLDDYTEYSRDDFPWTPPVTLRLRARASESHIPGTWGFGFWNDPFSFSLGLGGGTRRFPALPNAVWFFYASPKNYLSFRDDLPANGLIAQTFHSLRLPTSILALGVPGFPLLLWPWLARKLRSILRHLIAEDSFPFNVDLTQWHNFSLEWRTDHVFFKVDDQIFETKITPNKPLGFVIWIDNQFAAFPPNGELSYGTIANPKPAWLKIESLRLARIAE